jgi:predicted flap endonuclease-1-like 5' DNA nuclease
VEGIGATFEQRLADAGIETLGALAELTETELARLAQLETLGPGMTVTRLETWRAEARELMRQELPQ